MPVISALSMPPPPGRPKNERVELYLWDTAGQAMAGPSPTQQRQASEIQCREAQHGGQGRLQAQPGRAVVPPRIPVQEDEGHPDHPDVRSPPPEAVGPARAETSTATP